jgi:hypothetical protein
MMSEATMFPDETGSQPPVNTVGLLDRLYLLSRLATMISPLEYFLLALLLISQEVQLFS